MQSLEFNMTKLPVWIQLGNVPLELFLQKGISYITSVLGNPLYMDNITANQQQLAYAKACVEIEATLEIPCSIEVELKYGIPWLPAKCSHCCIFGYRDKTCPKRPVEPIIAKAWGFKA